ncbi:MAG: O-antigen ligase family protein, partial [Bryobacteraceae bacterium]
VTPSEHYGERGRPLQWRDGRVLRGVLLQVVVCIAPAMISVSQGNPWLGAQWLFITLFAFMGLNLVVSSAPSTLALCVALLPGAMLLRDLLLYNIILVLLVLAMSGFLRSRNDLTRVFRTPGLAWLLFFAALYWLSSYAMTGRYFVNLRVIELVLAVGALVLLAPYREHLATALYGMTICLVAIGCALLTYGERLGLVQTADFSLGNPISFGVPLTLLLLVLGADRAKWLLLQRRPLLRLLLTTLVGILLLLSTSRGSWLVAGTVLMILLLDRYDRMFAAASVGLLSVATVVILQTERGAALGEWYERTFSGERTLSQRTSGRSDQWMIYPAVVRDMPVWGFGPGSGPTVYAHYSARDPRVRLKPGREFAWHSLYQHLTVETGMIGGILMLMFFGYTFRRNYTLWQSKREITPLLGTLSFMLIAATVSGMDAISGLFLGFGLAQCTTAEPITRTTAGGSFGAGA